MKTLLNIFYAILSYRGSVRDKWYQKNLQDNF